MVDVLISQSDNSACCCSLAYAYFSEREPNRLKDLIMPIYIYNIIMFTTINIILLFSVNIIIFILLLLLFLLLLLLLLLE